MKHPTAKTHVVVFVALLALLAISFGVSFLPLGAWGTSIAIFVGFVKAGLVGLFFMHLIEAKTSVVFGLLTGLFLFAVLIAGSIADVETRPVVDDWIIDPR